MKCLLLFSKSIRQCQRFVFKASRRNRSSARLIFNGACGPARPSTPFHTDRSITAPCEWSRTFQLPRILTEDFFSVICNCFAFRMQWYDVLPDLRCDTYWRRNYIFWFIKWEVIKRHGRRFKSDNLVASH